MSTTGAALPCTRDLDYDRCHLPAARVASRLADGPVEDAARTAEAMVDPTSELTQPTDAPYPLPPLIRFVL